MEYLKVWTSFRELLEPLTDAERGRLFVAMLEFAESGAEPQLSGSERYVWPAARQSINNTRDKSEQMRSNRIRSNQNGTNENKTEQNGTKPNSPFDKDKVKDNIFIEDDEEEDEDNNRRVRDVWLGAFGSKPTPALINRLLSSGMGIDMIEKAIRISAAKAPQRPADFVLAVLRDWKGERLTIEDVDEYLMINDAISGKIAFMNRDDALDELQKFRQRKKVAS